MAKLLQKPELLAPAGDEESLKAAIAAGADAVYFGLRGGFNARARADNFAAADLPRIFDFLHARGVQGFVTFNTLVFDRELAVAEEALSEIARAGADAVLVQDLGIAQLVRKVCPGLPLHASTQMTISSPEAARIAKSLGVTRVVLPRELSIAEIRAFAAGTDLELECFVHGALCVSWSGQCLTSEALQHRSANRGQCAQSCRMPYDLVVDGRLQRARGDEHLKYLLSPTDLAAWDLLPDLLAAGVSCFKIEGRMKGPEYVANAVDKYRRALDAAMERRPAPLSRDDEQELRYSFSRGFTHGFLDGSDHQKLVHGLYPGHRGVLVGRVEEVHARARHVMVRAEPDAPALKAGDRILFDQGKPEDDEPRGGLHACDSVAPGLLKLVFGGPDQTTLDLRLVKAGDVVWKAKDAEVTRRMKRIAARERKLGVSLTVRGAVGVPLVAGATDDLGRTAQVHSAMPLQAAHGKPLHEALIREKLCAFGETGFELRRLQLDLEGALALPPSELKRMRRELTDSLGRSGPQREPREVRTGHARDEIAAPLPSAEAPGAPKLIPLLRTLEQVDAALG
ncbi:MAG: peptidase U32 family protein, partial [Myxococcales bacterium]